MSATALEVMPEPMLSAELWASFVSLLRSYAAAASLSLPEPAEVSEAAHAVVLVCRSTRIEMRFDPHTAEVSWQRFAGADRQTGSFTILPEGSIAIAGHIRDLDHVAIEFVASVTHGGKGSAR